MEEQTHGPSQEQPGGQTATKPKPPSPRQLPPYRVLLHNDDENTYEFVFATLVELAALAAERATEVVHEADEEGVALILVTHKERAELYQEQFTSKGLTVTIEPEA